jgi:hypothetical protein
VRIVAEPLEAYIEGYVIDHGTLGLGRSHSQLTIG